MKNKGFTLIETVVGVAVFALVALAAYQAYTSLFLITTNNQFKIIALNLVNEQFEIMRNMPYTDIGIVNGIPNGKIPYQQTLTRGGVTYTVTATVRNIDQSFDGTVSASSTDTSAADNKLIELAIACPTCVKFTPIILTTVVAPKNLETASSNGVLTVKVFDANGVAIQDADVTVVNAKATTTITVNDVTDVNGNLVIVDAPPGSSAYAISVTKSGYSTDRTYPPGAATNTNPTKPDATVLVQQVTPTSFSIDRLSTLSFSSVTTVCAAVPNFSFNLVGSKLIGAGIYKYNIGQTTNSSGVRSLTSMEWDTYTASSTDAVYDLIGLSPLNPIALNPNSTQSVQLIVAPKTPRTLLVTVKDNATGLPLTDAVVNLKKNTSSYTSTKITGQGFLTQTDWSGGPGQSTTTSPTEYFSDDGNISVTVPVGDVTLKKPFTTYAPSGILESSTFDAGTASNFHNIYWVPSDQPVAAGTTSAKFQIATATTSTPTSWSYRGPDGTSDTYYTASGTSIPTLHNGDQFLRYKMFLSTESSSSTPNISDVSVTYTTSCTPPGQVNFDGLTSGTYTLTVARSGYATSTNSNLGVSASWAEEIVSMGP